MRGLLLLSLALMVMLVSSASALEIDGTGEGYFVTEARNAAGFQAESWAYSVDGHIKADPFAQADADHAEASVQGFASTDNGHVESGTLSTNNLHQTGSGTITNASIFGSGTIGMDYLGSVDMNNSYQSASANSADVKAYVSTNLSLIEGKASVDSMAKDASGNYARVVALAGPSAWIGTTQTVGIDSTSTSETMDIFGTNRDGLKAMAGQDPPPYLSAYSGSGNALGNTSVQYTISKGYLNTTGVVQDDSGGYIVPRSPSETSMNAYADSQQSTVNSDESGKIKFAQNELAIVSSQAAIYALGSTKWTFTFEGAEGNVEGELTANATQNGLDRTALIY